MITLKEQPHADIPQLRFLAVEKRTRARQLAEFDGATHKVIGHHDSLTEKVTVEHVLGFGRTAHKAKAMAESAGHIVFFCADNMGCSTRFEPGNQVAA